MLIKLRSLKRLNDHVVSEEEKGLVRKTAKFGQNPTTSVLVNYINNTDDPFPNLSPHPLAHSLLKTIPSAPDPVPQPPLLYCPHHFQCRRKPFTCSDNGSVHATPNSTSNLPTTSLSSSSLYTEYMGWNEKVR